MSANKTYSTTLSYREAVREAMSLLMHADSRVFLIGEDVGNYGGCYAVSKGLSAEFGQQRILDAPLCESGFVGAGIGAGKQLAAQHSHSLENWYAHVPGIKVLSPTTVADARYMLVMALADPDPVIIFEHVMLYNETDVVPCPNDCADKHKAAVRREEQDISLTTYGGFLGRTLQITVLLQQQNISVEVMELRCLKPLDTQTIFASVNKTSRVILVDEGRRTGSLAGGICAIISEHCFWSLDAPPKKVCSQEVPIPYPKHLEQAATPQVEQIVNAVEVLLNKSKTNLDMSQ